MLQKSTARSFKQNKKNALINLKTGLLKAMAAPALAAGLLSSAYAIHKTPDAPGTPSIRITEYMYNGSEFVEFTNTGSISVDMTGWSFDDDSRAPGTVSLSAFGIVQPGESVILAELSEQDFRARWNLCNAIKIIGGNSANLGRNDEINLFDASGNLVDRLAFGDEDIPGSPRTNNVSAWVQADGLGANDALKWTLSSLGDSEGSLASSQAGEIASPGKSTRATVFFDPCQPGKIRITEYMYNGSEFVEFTNIGGAPVDMIGWSFDDDSRAPGTVSLSAFGVVQPGESVILAEVSEQDFRTQWNLCNAVKVVGNNGTNLGRNDEINLFDASGNLVDRLAFGDEDIPGSPRTNNVSAWVQADGVGANDPLKWTLSADGDAEGSYLSTGGQIASPGKSTRAITEFNPCLVTEGAPTIEIDVVSTSNLLDGGAAASPASPYAISGVMNDGTDPAGNEGIYFTVGDDDTAVEDLTVSVTTGNSAVVPQANLELTGSGASYRLRITPASAGYAALTVTVSDGTHTTPYLLNYAASVAESQAARWHTGISDASTAIALDDDYMIVANDETNLLYVYHRHQSGMPVATYDFNQGNALALTDPSSAPFKEVDVEAGLKSIAHEGRVYFIGSMSNSSSFNDKPNRDRVFAVNVSGTGTGVAFSNTGGYARLRQHLISWGNSHGYNLSTSAAEGRDPKAIDGFNVEGAVFGPDNSTLYIGFRAPLVPTGSRTKALIAPVQNFESWFNNGAPSGNPVIGEPIELDLGLRGIREMIRLSNGNYVILAGSYGDSGTGGAVYSWSGEADQAAVLVPSLNISALNAEGVMEVAAPGDVSARSALRTAESATDRLQIISDNGNTIYYGDGVSAKDLSQNNLRKFSSDIVVGVQDALPVTLVSFTVREDEGFADIRWETADHEEGAIFKVLRSYDGYQFDVLYETPSLADRRHYSFRDDHSARNGRIYYRLGTLGADGKTEYSVIRTIEINGPEEKMLSAYPNPAVTGILTVTTADKDAVGLTIFNSLGAGQKQAEFKGSISFDTTGWPAGAYLLRLTTRDGKQYRRTVVIGN